jgi:antitoxin ParD1/3/4
MEVIMESLNISLPEPLKRFLDAQIATGRYSSASEYVCELIREDGKRKTEERVEALLLEGLEGEESELTGADWKVIRKEALAQIQSLHKAR